LVRHTGRLSPTPPILLHLNKLCDHNYPFEDQKKLLVIRTSNERRKAFIGRFAQMNQQLNVFIECLWWSIFRIQGFHDCNTLQAKTKLREPYSIFSIVVGRNRNFHGEHVNWVSQAPESM